MNSVRHQAQAISPLSLSLSVSISFFLSLSLVHTQSCGAASTSDKYAEKKKKSNGEKNKNYKKIRSREDDPVQALSTENALLLKEINHMKAVIADRKTAKPLKSAESTKIKTAKDLQKTRRTELAALKLELGRLEL